MKVDISALCGDKYSMYRLLNDGTCSGIANPIHFQTRYVFLFVLFPAISQQEPVFTQSHAAILHFIT